jgi:hypothetical protein
MPPCLTATQQPLFRRSMGRLFHLLPSPVKRQHGAVDILLSVGRCDIDRGPALTARLIGWLFKFPPPGRNLATKVTVIAGGGREIWHRDFGGNGIFTVLEPAYRHHRPVIVERFGIVTFDLALGMTVGMGDGGGGLCMTVVGMRAAGIAMPRWLWPVLRAVERAEPQRFVFDIDIRLAWGRPLIHYRGWLKSD